MKTQTYRDFDAFADTVGDIDATMMLQNPRNRLWLIEQTKVAGVHLQRGRLGSGNIVEGKWRSDGYGVYLPLSDRREYSCNGRPIDTQSFMVLDPDSEFCISTAEPHDWCTISVQASQMPTSGHEDGGSTSVREPECRASRPHPAVARRFYAIVDAIMTASAASEAFEGSPAARDAASAAARLVSAIVGETAPEPSHGTCGRPVAPRREILDRCQELLENDQLAQIRVCDLVAASGVSARTLDTAFREFFGTSPRRYVLLRRLQAVRQALLSADPDTDTVTEVLFKHGEWELGRFASRYRELYGELPSETLQRS